MNLLLIEPDQFSAPTTAVITGRQRQHLAEVLKAEQGSTIQAGCINGLQGTAIIQKLNDSEVTLDCHFNQPPPPPLPVKLIIALPRPKMMRRIIQTIATMGVKEVYFINSYKVDKSYWSTPWLNEEQLRENCILGLEQAKDTTLPLVRLRKRFKPFVEDELETLSEDTHKFIAHPGSLAACPTETKTPTTLVIGPEGGFAEYEVNKIKDVGFIPIHMGSRILRVETAIPALLAKIFPFSR